MKKITITIPLDIALEIATYGEYGKVSRNTQHYMEKQVKQMGYEKELNDLRDQKLKASAENLSDKKDKFDLDHYHYHEFLERCALLNNVIEEICDHPVKNAHGDLNDQVNKILDECGELYVMAGNKKFDFNDSVAADIRNKLTPMLTLVSIIQSGDIQNPELKPIIDDTIKSVLENVAYLSNIGE